MPRTNREYLIRYVDQAINDLERALDRLQLLSNTYGGISRPIEGGRIPVTLEVEENYEGAHAKYQKYIDIQATLTITVLNNLRLFKQRYM